jgi:hypothetical protein
MFSTLRVRFLCAVLLACCWCASASADVVVGQVLPLQQPDGTILQVRIWGDEFYTVVESLAGYTLVRDPGTGFIVYARLSPDGNTLVSTGVRADEAVSAALGLTAHLRINAAAAAAQARAARAEFMRRMREGPDAPPAGRAVQGRTTGNVQGICLLVDFSDDPGTIPPAEVVNYCNLPGYSNYGNNGSVRDYSDVSRSLTYTNYVPEAYHRAAPDLPPVRIPYGQKCELILEAEPS